MHVPWPKDTKVPPLKVTTPQVLSPAGQNMLSAEREASMATRLATGMGFGVVGGGRAVVRALKSAAGRRTAEKCIVRLGLLL